MDRKEKKNKERLYDPLSRKGYKDARSLNATSKARIRGIKEAAALAEQNSMLEQGADFTAESFSCKQLESDTWLT